MDTNTNSQAEQNSLEKTGKVYPKRLKARHLSALTKQIIAKKFAASESFDDVAKDMGIPGLSARVISEVLHSIQIRKHPGVALNSTGSNVVSMARRSA